MQKKTLVEGDTHFEVVRKGQKYFTNKIPATVKYNYNV